MWQVEPRTGLQVTSGSWFAQIPVLRACSLPSPPARGSPWEEQSELLALSSCAAAVKLVGTNHCRGREVTGHLSPVVLSPRKEVVLTNGR